MKKIYCLLSLIPAITVFILTPIATHAQFSGGNGTENSPYIITTAEQLAQLASYAIGNVNGSSIVGGVVGNFYSGVISNCFATGNTLSNNIAFEGVLNNNNEPVWNPKGATTNNGEDIYSTAIISDGTLGGRFTSSNGWTTQNGKLPGLFGNTVELPIHLRVPYITIENLPDGTAGITYSQSLTAGGITPITWVLTSGSLPNGLSLSTTGTISGTPTVAGIFNFTVKATNNWGNDTKALNILIEDGVGISESELSKITLYPNPTQTRLTVKRLESSKIKVVIYNNLGTMIKTFETISDEIIVDVSNFSSGLYFIQLFNAKSSTIKSFVKE